MNVGQMNYFDFFEMEETFIIDEDKLKKQYLLNSRKYHPDFHTLAGNLERDEALKISTINNAAYDTLRDFDKRMEYVLRINGILVEDGQNKVSKDFLIEMMDINEALMEIEMMDKNERIEEVISQLNELKNDLNQSIEEDLKKYRKNTPEAQLILNKIKDYYLKNKYLLRIKEKINTFVS